MPWLNEHERTCSISSISLHTIHGKHLKSVVLKIDLSKAYDRASWTYLRVLLSKMGFSGLFITWVMSSLSSVSFDVLINGVASVSLRPAIGLRHNSPLSPPMFLLVAKGLSRYVEEEKAAGIFKDIIMCSTLHISHLLLLDDILIFCDGSNEDALKHKEIYIYIVRLWVLS